LKKKTISLLIFSIMGIFIMFVGIINIAPVNADSNEIKHIPVKYAYSGYDLLISCDVSCSNTPAAVLLMIRKPGVWQYNSTTMKLGFGNTYYAVIPSENISSSGLEYYIKVYVNVNVTITYPTSNASDNPLRITVLTYTESDVSPTAFYVGIIAITIFAVLYAVDIIDIKNPWGGKKNE